MLLQILAFEFKLQRRAPLFWVAAGLFFLFAFGATASDAITLGTGSPVLLNSPFRIVEQHLVISIFYMIVTPAFIASVVVRDDETGFRPIIWSTRVSKFDYLMGRFAGASLAAIVAFGSVPLGMWLGSLMPWLDPQALGPARADAYFFAYVILAAPGILFTASIYLTLAIMTRSLMATYLGVIGLMIPILVAASLYSKMPEFRSMIGIAEPFGFGAFLEMTTDWAIARRNQDLPNLTGPLLGNRLFWASLSIFCLAAAYRRFSFASPIGAGHARRKRISLPSAGPIGSPYSGPLPSGCFDAATAWGQFRARAALEIWQMVKNPAFLVLIALGLANASLSVWNVVNEGGPATDASIAAVRRAFTLVSLIIAIYFSGELVWRERDSRVHEMIDATPLPDWAYAAPKTVAMGVVLAAILAASALAGLLAQLLKGDEGIEPSAYLWLYLLPGAFDVTLIAILAVFVQSVSPNKYVGWAVMILCILTRIVAADTGFGHDLIVYGQVPSETHNGFRIEQDGAWWFRLYWASIAALLMVASHLLWRRGNDLQLGFRFKRGSARLRGPVGLVAAAAATMALVVGLSLSTTGMQDREPESIARSSDRMDDESLYAVGDVPGA
ncbi:hypothetical protein [Sphingosinicella rhizophila]|uniref:ABC-2 family transporter protein n=1 Tax=Sphingosinicella rhizophila TaxID=3050082 RepID=A0ABU3Q373_9SPHN|nr:hypothetical protein [Sphingosinicella sp. GR2756]MDT9597415.1 hypothetical protein [Sphingosinicella sp. GR2756]